MYFFSYDPNYELVLGSFMDWLEAMAKATEVPAVAIRP